jgi:catechol 2,3-dioxygenase-like lactoylglutathione lyase family enzyme
MAASEMVTDRPTVPFHLSLNVADLARSVEFFRRLFDLEPAKQHGDYAKFEVAEPPLVLSLEPNEANAGAKLGHLGIRLPNSAQLVELQRRLESQGISCLRENGAECCYARQTKFWVTDPDGNLWEIYALEEDLDCRGTGQAAMPRLHVARQSVPQSTMPLPTVPQPVRLPAPSIWVHRLGDGIPERLMIESGSVDEVLLQGSFNLPLEHERRRHLLAEVRRILQPEGRVVMHGLTADRSAADLRGRLSGPAAVVEFVPATSDVVAELAAAGFSGLYFSKLSEFPCFTVDGLGLRETQIIGFNRLEPPSTATHAVLYKGPFRHLEDDFGLTYRRGAWTSLDESSWRRLRSSRAADDFLFDAPAVED